MNDVWTCQPWVLHGVGENGVITKVGWLKCHFLLTGGLIIDGPAPMTPDTESIHGKTFILLLWHAQAHLCHLVHIKILMDRPPVKFALLNSEYEAIVSLFMCQT